MNKTSTAQEFFMQFRDNPTTVYATIPDILSLIIVN